MTTVTPASSEQATPEQAAPEQAALEDVRRVLVIKLSALGDVFQALGPVEAIRAHHRHARITVLTTAPYKDLFAATGCIDDIWLDRRPKWYQPLQWMDMKRQFQDRDFHIVYDLQTSDRSNAYFRLLPKDKKPLWSGIAAGCSHPHGNPRRDTMHTVERQAEQLHMTGIHDVPLSSCDWAGSLDCDLVPSRPYGLLVPGGAPHRPGKRWPTSRYAELAGYLSEQGILPVLIGTASETAVLEQVAGLCPAVLNLCNRTSIVDLVSLARNAVVAVGNDTGPMHGFAISGCPCVVLYSSDSDPALCAQRGTRVKILRQPNLQTLPMDDVTGAIRDVTSLFS